MAERTVRALRRPDGLVEFLDPIELPAGQMFTVSVELPKAPVGAARSLQGAFPELGALSDEDIAEAAGMWERGAEKQIALLHEGRRSP